MNHNQAQPQVSDKEADLMDKPGKRPVRRDLPRQERRARPKPAATVGLVTAARTLGISPDEACDLVKRGEFPASSSIRARATACHSRPCCESLVPDRSTTSEREPSDEQMDA